MYFCPLTFPLFMKHPWYATTFLCAQLFKKLTSFKTSSNSSPTSNLITLTAAC